MKKYLFAFCFLYSTIGLGQSMVSVNSGYNSGFVFDASYGWTTVKFEKNKLLNFPEEYGFSGSLGYKIASFNGEFYHGPKLNTSGYLGLFYVGLDGVYYFKDEASKFVLEPAIGLSLFSSVVLKFTYNISDTHDFFPNNYKNWGISLGVNIKLDEY